MIELKVAGIPDGFETYQLWVAIKNHFTTKSYDYNKYGGKVRITRESFNKRRDKAFFYRLGSRYKDYLKSFFLSVYCRDGNRDLWIGEMLESTYDMEFKKWQKRNQAFTRTFTQDAKIIREFLEEHYLPFKQILVSSNGNLPPIVQLEILEHISPETLIVVDRLTNFTTKYCMNPLWDDTVQRLTKYNRFVIVDNIRELAQILKEEIDKLPTN